MAYRHYTKGGSRIIFGFNLLHVYSDQQYLSAKRESMSFLHRYIVSYSLGSLLYASYKATRPGHVKGSLLTLRQSGSEWRLFQRREAPGFGRGLLGGTKATRIIPPCYRITHSEVSLASGATKWQGDRSVASRIYQASWRILSVFFSMRLTQLSS